MSTIEITSARDMRQVGKARYKRLRDTGHADEKTVRMLASMPARERDCYIEKLMTEPVKADIDLERRKRKVSQRRTAVFDQASERRDLQRDSDALAAALESTMVDERRFVDLCGRLARRSPNGAYARAVREVPSRYEQPDMATAEDVRRYRDAMTVSLHFDGRQAEQVVADFERTGRIDRSEDVPTRCGRPRREDTADIVEDYLAANGFDRRPLA